MYNDDIDTTEFDPDTLTPATFREDTVDTITGYSHPDYQGMLLPKDEVERVLSEIPGQSDYFVDKDFVDGEMMTVRYLQTWDGVLQFVHTLVGFHGSTPIYEVGVGWVTWTRVN